MTEKLRDQLFLQNAIVVQLPFQAKLSDEKAVHLATLPGVTCPRSRVIYLCYTDVQKRNYFKAYKLHYVSTSSTPRIGFIPA